MIEHSQLQLTNGTIQQMLDKVAKTSALGQSSTDDQTIRRGVNGNFHSFPPQFTRGRNNINE